MECPRLLGSGGTWLAGAHGGPPSVLHQRSSTLNLPPIRVKRIIVIVVITGENEMRMFIACAILLLATSANATTITSHKTGARANVGSQHAAAFQAYINDLEASGARVRFMGGIRPGRCSSRHMHPCGRALDVCQLSRGVVDHRCNLPGPSQMAAIAARHGLFEGGQWCHSDYGHAQVGVSAPACGGHHYATRHRHRRVASR
jgi:hypothetical protein